MTRLGGKYKPADYLFIDPNIGITYFKYSQFYLYVRKNVGEKMTVSKEHQVIAYSAAYLIGKESTKIIKLAVKKKHVEEVKDLMKKALEEKYDIDDEEIRMDMVDTIAFNERDECDIYGHYYTGGNKQRNVYIEAKGGSVTFGIYTLIGQLVTMRTNQSDYHWYGAACPATWKDNLKKKMIHEGEIKPIIQTMIDNYTKYKRGLKFYFAYENGDVEVEHWHNFLK